MEPVAHRFMSRSARASIRLFILAGSVGGTGYGVSCIVRTPARSIAPSTSRESPSTSEITDINCLPSVDNQIVMKVFGMI
jgi:hypothetical protein